MTIETSSIWQKFKLPMTLGGVSLFSIGVSSILLIKSTQTTIPIQFFDSREVLSVSKEASVSANPPAGGQKVIHVDVEGGVRAPGLYKLSSASRIADAIAKAGGLTEEADEEAMVKSVNQASVLVDGAKIYIPKKGDHENTSHIIKSDSNNIVTSDNILININTASENELDSLSGVGPATVKKIIDHRPYQTLEELVSKKAIGNALFEKIKEKLSL